MNDKIIYENNLLVLRCFFHPDMFSSDKELYDYFENNFLSIGDNKARFLMDYEKFLRNKNKSWLEKYDSVIGGGIIASESSAERILRKIWKLASGEEWKE